MLQLLVDSKEQKPLEFTGECFGEVTTRSLPYGDYCCEINGVLVPISFERKGFGDLFGTMGKGYPRFKKEMQRARDDKARLILVIEGSLEKVLSGYEYSSIKGESMLKKLAMLHIRHGLEYHFFNNRAEMARFIAETFSAFNRNFKQKGK